MSDLKNWPLDPERAYLCVRSIGSDEVDYFTKGVTYPAVAKDTLIDNQRSKHLVSKTIAEKHFQVLPHLQQAGETDTAPDLVNHPPHYTQGKVETIDAIESAVGPEGFEGYLVGNVLKYLSRYKHKNGLEDLRKAEWYLCKLIKTKEGN